MKRICFALAFFSVLLLPVLVLAQPAPDARSRHALLRSAPSIPHEDHSRQTLVQSGPDMPSDDRGQYLLARYDLVALPDVLGAQQVHAQPDLHMQTDDPRQHTLTRTAIDVPADILAGQHPLALLDAAALADARSRHILTPAALDVSADGHDQRILARPAPVMPPDMLAGQHALAELDPNAPHDDIGQHIGNIVDAVRSGSAIAIAAALIMLLTSLFKAPWLGSLFVKIPKRWRIAIPIILSGIAGVLSSIIGGIPWQEAVLVGLFAGPTAVFAHEAVVEAILGHARTRTPHLAS